jgi:uncharacterized protein YbbC (DUF1343 family)
MVRSGLECFLEQYPDGLKGKRVGVVCHAASITSDYTHILDALAQHPSCRLGAVFGPQHGLWGETQDNMVEWEGNGRTLHQVPVYSLYGMVRKPTPAMLGGLDALVFDLQDAGARPYTYLWTLKLCMESCSEEKLPLYVLDRPNPSACMDFDGPLLKPEYFSFVGGAEIPLCHRLTIGEIAVLLQGAYYPKADVRVVWMQGWRRTALWDDTGLPWVLPSPNMPTPHTALVYPGMVLLEGTNLSEGRGTTRPFELFGAPYLDSSELMRRLEAERLRGCVFRAHDFIPAFQKWAGKECRGMQLHVIDPRAFRPVEAAYAVLSAVHAVAPGDFAFRTDPYEYERRRPAIDILSGSDRFRKAVLEGAPLAEMREEWKRERGSFFDLFRSFSRYAEDRP